MNNFSSLIENSKQAVRYWWLLLIIGIALFAVGVLIFVYPAQSYLGMSLVFGWLMLISGILEVVLSSVNKHFITGRGWMLAGGGYDAAAKTQNSATITIIISLFTLAPAVCYLLSAVIAKRYYTLKTPFLKKMMAELAQGARRNEHDFTSAPTGKELQN